MRPSQLSAVTNNPGPSTKNPLQPAKFHNPFTKLLDNIETEGSNDAAKMAKNDSNESRSKEDTKPKFLPLGVNTKENENGMSNTVAPSASTPSFIFGQNLKERVAVANDAEGSNSSEEHETKEEESNENGSSEMLFSSVATVCRTTSRPGLTLSQAAQELEEASRANKRKYSQVTLLTGEEGETNVLQINCKLFAFDKVISIEFKKKTLFSYYVIELIIYESLEKSFSFPKKKKKTQLTFNFVKRCKNFFEYF